MGDSGKGMHLELDDYLVGLLSMCSELVSHELHFRITVEVFKLIESGLYRRTMW